MCKNNSKNHFYCRLCFTRRYNICCQQVFKINTVKSYRTEETFKIFHPFDYKCSYLIYLQQCPICQLKYVGKSETSFNIRLNNLRKDSKNKNLSKGWEIYPNSTNYESINFIHNFKFHLLQSSGTWLKILVI